MSNTSDSDSDAHDTPIVKTKVYHSLCDQTDFSHVVDQIWKGCGQDNVKTRLFLNKFVRIHYRRKLKKTQLLLKHASPNEKQALHFIRQKLSVPARIIMIDDWIQTYPKKGRLVNYFMKHYIHQVPIGYYLNRASYPYVKVGEYNNINQSFKNDENCVWIDLQQEYNRNKINPDFQGKLNLHGRGSVIYDKTLERSINIPKYNLYIWLSDIDGFTILKDHMNKCKIHRSNYNKQIKLGTIVKKPNVQRGIRPSKQLGKRHHISSATIHISSSTNQKGKVNNSNLNLISDCNNSTDVGKCYIKKHGRRKNLKVSKSHKNVNQPIRILTPEGKNIPVQHPEEVERIQRLAKENEKKIEHERLLQKEKDKTKFDDFMIYSTRQLMIDSRDPNQNQLQDHLQIQDSIYDVINMNHIVEKIPEQETYRRKTGRKVQNMIKDQCLIDEIQTGFFI